MKPVLPLFAFVLAIASIGHAQQDTAVRHNAGANADDQLRLTHEQKVQAAAKEFDTRIAEYRAGRSPINVVLQSNQRLLVAALDAKVPNAGLDYDKRAATLESLAKHMLDSGSGTVTELAQTREFRLDVILRNSIGSSNTR